MKLRGGRDRTHNTLVRKTKRTVVLFKTDMWSLPMIHTYNETNPNSVTMFKTAT